MVQVSVAVASPEVEARLVGVSGGLSTLLRILVTLVTALEVCDARVLYSSMIRAKSELMLVSEGDSVDALFPRVDVAVCVSLAYTLREIGPKYPIAGSILFFCCQVMTACLVMGPKYVVVSSSEGKMFSACRYVWRHCTSVPSVLS